MANIEHEISENGVTFWIHPDDLKDAQEDFDSALIETGRIYYFERYQIEDESEELLKGNKVFFQLV